MDFKRKKVYLLVFISALVVALISGTFAYYQASITNNDVISGTIASLSLKLDVTKVTSGEGLIPLQESLISSAAKASCIDNNGYTACQIYKLTLTNQSNIATEVDGYITLISSTSSNLKWTELTSQTTYGSASKRGMSRSQLVSKDKISANGSKTYYIMVYLNDTNTEQNLIDKGTFGGLVEFNTNDGTISETLGDDTSSVGGLYLAIKNQAVADNVASTYVTSSSGIDFSSISSDTNGKGIYMLSSTESDTYPIYYYRGAVTNNNVIFGGFCWKIVRTTETGGVKLIYNGTPSNNQCTNITGTSTQIEESVFNSNYDYNAYVGYMYGTPNSSTYEEEHANTNNSTIKTVIDNWYKSNLTDYTSKLEDTIWCDDRSIDTVSGNGTGLGYGTNQTATAYNASYRLYTNKNPSLSCANVNDRFTVSTSNGNGALTYPVALLTADEIAYAGGVQGTSNSTYYLNTNWDWWSLSPFYFGSGYANGWYVNSGGYLNLNDVYRSYGVRPAVSLAPGTEFESGGTGESTSPYIVK